MSDTPEKTMRDELAEILDMPITPETASGVLARATRVIARAAVTQAEAAEIQALCAVLTISHRTIYSTKEADAVIRRIRELIIHPAPKESTPA
jgi:hypothetical protein